MSTEWVARQLLAYPVALSAPNARQARPPFNPRPAGIVRPGSVSFLVLLFMEQDPKRWYWQRQITAGIGRSDKTVAWALVYLRAQGLIESTQRATSTNPRYLMYRLVSQERLQP